MGDSRVETISRLAQWRIDNFGLCTYRKSDPFRMGIWNWHISLEKNRYFYVRLFPEASRTSKEQPPLARFILRVSSFGYPRRAPHVSQALERLLRTSDDFVWPVDSTLNGRFIIDVEFLDLKIYPYEGAEACSIWPSDGMLRSVTTLSVFRCLSRMLEESIHVDVTIKTNDGVLKAHKAILAASSPVFDRMFHHDLKEKVASELSIEDMSTESCVALLSYLYGNIKQEDFWKHRLALLAAANKYDISELKVACEESLIEDIDLSNVLGRLQEAWLYQLNKLKESCLIYLFDFGKIHDIQGEMNNFFRDADRELIFEMFQVLLRVNRHL